MNRVRQLSWATIAGFSGALAVSVMEIVALPAAERSLGMWLVLAGSLVTAGVVAGLAWGTWFVVVDEISRRLTDKRSRWSAELVIGLLSASVVAPGVIWLVGALARGRQARQLIGALPVRAAICAALTVTIVGTLWAAARLARRLTVKPRDSRWLSLALGIAAMVGACCLFFADARLYRRLYLYLHAALLAGYLTLASVAALCLFALRSHREGGRRSSRVLVGAALLVTVGSVVATGSTRWQLARDQRYRFVVLEQSTASAKLVALAPLAVAASSPTFLDIDGDAVDKHDPPRARAGLSTAAPVDSTPRYPGANVVVVTVDALRADHLGTYGYRRPTSPNIDAVARRATRFAAAYCQVPLTCYSIPSLMTGDYLRSTLTLLPRPPPTLAEMLNARGYVTAAFFNDSIFFCDDQRATSYGRKRFGFRYAETKLRSAPELTDRVLDYLRRHVEGKRQRLFLWVHYFDVHEPYRARREHRFGERDVDLYDGEVAYTDVAIGRLVAALSRLRGPTIFVLTADHGEEFREHGGAYHGSSLYDEQIRVPLIIGLPGGRGRTSRAPAQLVDVVPTLLELIGVPIPPSVRGRSLLPLVAEKKRDRAAYAEIHTKKMVRFGDWKLIHDFRRSTNQLYNLARDPQERNNLIARRPRRAVRLKARLFRWFDRLRQSVAKQHVDRPEPIELGRLGDRRAVPGLGALLTDPTRTSRWRREAALLLGQLNDPRGRRPLWIAAGDDDRGVAREASIALGELQDRRARDLLFQALASRDGDTRTRAAIAAARVGSAEGQDALIESLYSANWALANRAAHYLGYVGDRTSVGPMIEVAHKLQLRGRIAVALARIGRRHAKERRILPFLKRLALTDRHLEVRHRAVAGIGMLGDRRAISTLHGMILSDPDVTSTAESLTRLGAVGGAVSGVDARSGARELRAGWGRCHHQRSESIERYVGSTWCSMASQRASLVVKVHRRMSRPLLIARFRGRGAPGVEVRLRLRGRTVTRVAVSRGWRDVRVKLPAGLIQIGENSMEIVLHEPAKRDRRSSFDLDYVLVVDASRP